MSIRKTIISITDDKGADIITKPSFMGLMDDYGAFADQMPAVKEIFRKLSQNGYLVKLASMGGDSWTFNMKSLIFEISNNYGFQTVMVADLLKEIAFGIHLISDEVEWSEIEQSVTPPPATQAAPAAPAVSSLNTASSQSVPVATAARRRSIWDIFKIGHSDGFKVGKYVEEKTGRIIPKLDHLSLSAKMQEIEQFAQAQSAGANYLLGLMYLDGKGVKTDKGRAFTYFETAANLGYLHACNMMGECYRYGWGVQSDTDEAAQWYYKAASRKLRPAIKNLGTLYHDVGNDREALLWLKKAGDYGDADAAFRMAGIYLNGSPDVRDEKQAFRHYTAGALMRHLPSMYMTGVLLLEGRGTEKSTEMAIRFFTKAAEKGYIEAQYKLGCIYWNRWCAIPISYFPTKPEEEQRKADELKNQAYFWLKKAKDAGHKDATTLFNKICW